MTDGDLDFHPFGAPPCGVCGEANCGHVDRRPARDHVGPLSTRRDDAAVAEADNRRARRPRRAS